MDNDAMSNSTRNDPADIKENFYKVKNVFQILIAEATFLIDEKAMAMCEGKPQKEAFLVMIDSIRKSLGIDSMEDVQLLVDVFYEYDDEKKRKIKEEEEKRREALENDQGSNNAANAPPANPAPDANKAGANGAAANGQPLDKTQARTGKKEV